MKKGKSKTIKGSDIFKISYGTVDYHTMKSIYVTLQSWVEPKYDIENWDRIIKNMSRDIKHKLLDVLDYELFKPFNIVDLDLRTSGIELGKRSFMSVEITLYLDKFIEFRSKELHDEIKKICFYVIRNSILDSNYFDYYLSKKKNNARLSSDTI